MNDNEIPTPETDAAVKRFVGLSGDRYLVEADVARSLERRLSVARGALVEIDRVSWHDKECKYYPPGSRSWRGRPDYAR